MCLSAMIACININIHNLKFMNIYDLVLYGIKISHIASYLTQFDPPILISDIYDGKD
jgi:hypothetical protein